MKVVSINAVEGEIDLPGDKSISHRAAIFAALAEGTSTITNFSTSEDCLSTLDCLRALGVRCEQTGSTVSITGVGKRGLTKPSESLDCGNSGTTMRLLSGVLAGQDFETTLTGDDSLSKRPMNRIATPLSEMGAGFESVAGKPPLRIKGVNPINAISYNLPVASAQIKSAVLLAGLNGRGVTKVISSAAKKAVSSSRNHTELMLKFFGAKIDEAFVETDEGFIHEVAVDGESNLSARDIFVPCDVSAAAFFIVAAGTLSNSKILFPNVGVNPTRIAFIDVLRRFGAGIDFVNTRDANNEPIADIEVRSGGITENDGEMKLSGDVIANLIDEVPILAILGTQLKNGLEIRDARELRVKESDRIASVVENLRRMGARVEEFDDGFRVENTVLKGATIESFGDHRIAMAFAIAGLLASGETEIIGHECADVSFPGFFDVLASVIK